MEKKLMGLLFLTAFFQFALLCGNEKPLSIVIIGAGPAGLATAIEAHGAGANVIIVEKRECYTRDQYFFIFEPTLSILTKWKVSVPDFVIGYDSDNEAVGFTLIKNLEIGLEDRVRQLGIKKIRGEFKEIKDGKAIIVQKNQELEFPYDLEIELSYDLLVGADGENSVVCKQLEIGSSNLGNAIGFIAILKKENSNIGFVLPFLSESLFINKVRIPSATIVSAQSHEISREQLATAALREEWTEEAKLISERKGIFFENIPVVLKQSLTFSNREKSAIILGDAAGTASFLQGLGANTALQSAVVAGRFFKTERNESDYAEYNQAIQELTDRLIFDSEFLFK